MRGMVWVMGLVMGCGGAAPVATATTSASVATVGAAAPTFSLTGLDGTTYKLEDQRGKTVVLEWYNPDCPYVKYGHGEGGPLETLGNTWAGKDVVWWAINSGAPGNQGHGVERNQASLAEYGIEYPVLLDESGDVGRMYEAKTTPHMYVIDGAGQLVYAGAIDNAPFGDSGGKAVVNYVDTALTAMAAGEDIATAKTKPYGCSVKY